MIAADALEALGEAPDPEMARLALSRMDERPQARELLARPGILSAATRLFGLASSAADFFLRHPEDLEELQDLRPRSQGELDQEVGLLAPAIGPWPAVRRFRRRAGFRVAARDLAGAPVEQVMAELSRIAEACLKVAVRHADGPAMAVIGLGKLGGQELNYSSDVDILFVHSGSGPSTQAEASRAAAGVIAMLSEPTEEGLALRVDVSLRPEGRAGPLSRSLDSMVEYYERHAATWERQALLKSRAVAGDGEVSAAFLEAVVPFVFPAILPTTAIEEVRASKARIEERVRLVGKQDSELKRGRGGIRDVEFAVQLLQLVHGRRDERLRRPNTLRALRVLGDEGYVAAGDARILAESYRFLRRLEHRLQLARDLQTHELPADRHAMGTLARSMGLRDASHLLADHAAHTDRVRTLHERLFYRPLLEAFAGSEAPRPAVDREATQELLRGLGFADPQAAYRAFERLVDPSTRLGKVLGSLFPVVAPALAFSTGADAALGRFQRITEGAAGDRHLPDLLADRPDGARRLAALAAASSAFSDLLTVRPELVRAVFDLPAPERTLFPVDPAAELVRVAGSHVTGELRPAESGRRLAGVADGLISGILEGIASPVPMAIVGLGGLGSEELTFGSDLDLLFVYEGEGPEDFAGASAAAEQTLEEIRAAGWRPDPDLRPEGRNGPLARSMASFLEYWERWAETWEYQALLRARFIAGDEMLGRRFLSNAADFAYPEAITFEQTAAIRRMRVRMEEERVRPAEAGRFHFKLGYGGLADVQFAVELSLMRFGFAHPQVRRANTLEALEALAAARLIEHSVARSLAEAFLFLTQVKNALEVARRLPVEALPPTPEEQVALAHRLGYGGRARQRFLEDYRRITRRARLGMERVFYPE